MELNLSGTNKKYFLSEDENILLVKDGGQTRILANWRDLEEEYRFSVMKLSKLQYWWENDLSSIGSLIESGKLDIALTEIVSSEREAISAMAKQLGGGLMGEMLAREIWRS